MSGRRVEQVADREFLTELARFVRSLAFASVPGWYRAKLAERMLDAKSSAERDALALQWEAARDLLGAMENEIENRQGEIDGRAIRYFRTKH